MFFFRVGQKEIGDPAAYKDYAVGKRCQNLADIYEDSMCGFNLARVVIFELARIVVHTAMSLSFHSRFSRCSSRASAAS